jgi:hypothetical protein
MQKLFVLREDTNGLGEYEKIEQKRERTCPGA